MAKIILLAVDMDGVLAIWKPVSRTEYSTPGYFYSLEGQNNLISAIKELAAEGANICIASHAINDTAKKEKKDWNSDRNIDVPQVYPAYGSNKADAIKELYQELVSPLSDEVTYLLLDDYTKNLRDWESYGNNYIGIKWLNGVNSTHGTWDGLTLNHNASKDALKKQLRLLLS